MRDPPSPIRLAGEALEAIVGAKGVAAAFDEGEHPAERRLVEPRIGRGGADLGQHPLLAEGSGAGNGHDVLGENVERAGAELIVIEHAFLDGVEGRATFRSEEHTSELQSLMRISYAVFCL